MNDGEAQSHQHSPDAELADQLLSERGKKLRIVGHRPLVAALRVAVRDALESQLGIRDPNATAAVVGFAENRMLGQLRSRGRQGRGFSHDELLGVMESVRAHYVRTQAQVRNQIGDLEAELERRRGALADEEAALLGELDRLGDPAAHPIAERIRELVAEAGLPGPESAALLDELMPMVLGEIQGERRKGMEFQLGQHRRQIDTLERRIAKLAESLEASEANLRRVAQMKNLDPGLASIYRQVQGLDDGASFADLKREMLAKIFEANVDLREELERLHSA